MQQTDLIDLIKELPPHCHYRETSRQGAEHAKPSAATQCSVILFALQLAGRNGLTSSELRARTDIKQASTMSARLNSLMNAGKIKDSGLRRKSPASVMNIVWIIN